MAWHLAPSLKILRFQIDTGWPARSKTADGAIGDAAHAARVSDHNPDADDSSVNAWDITTDPVNGPDLDALAGYLIRDPRTNYVVWNRRIWSQAYPYWRPYSGTDPHTGHLHISITHTADAENSTALWFIQAPPAPEPPPEQEDAPAMKPQIVWFLDDANQAHTYLVLGLHGKYLDQAGADLARFLGTPETNTRDTALDRKWSRSLILVDGPAASV